MRKPLAALLLVMTASFAHAQQPTGKVYTDADYAQAERFMPYNVDPLVLHNIEHPEWLSGDRVVYRDAGSNGATYYLIDAATGIKRPAFDSAKLAAALQPFSPTPAKPLNPNRLPIRSVELPAPNTLEVSVFGRQLSCDLSADPVVCKDAAPAGHAALKPGLDALSPDGRTAAFIRDWNLWLLDIASGKEYPLTRDGVPNFGYATDNAGWTHSGNPILVWSPDSRRIATFQQDQRKTGELYLTNVVAGHPTLTTLKYPLPGDKDITMIERVVIDVAKPNHPKVIRLKMPPDQHRSTLCDDIHCSRTNPNGWDDVQWAADSKTLAFVSTSRDHKQEWFRLANPENGDVKTIFDETAPDFFESGNGAVNWRYLSATNQVLWFSERTGWGHLYLYDATTGQLKRALTHGDWNVTEVLSVQTPAPAEPKGAIFFRAVGHELGEDPYYQMFFRVNFDGQGSEGENLTLLTPERADHTISLSPDSKYFVDAYSTPIAPQITVLRDAMGREITGMAHEDISRLKAAGWIPPVQIEVKARDGLTDVYGFLFRPTNFTTSGHYPIINHIYPGPQTGSCGSRSFSAAHGDMQSLAELGFIVVCIDGEGTPFRSKAFHQAYYGNMGDDTLPDQVSGMKDLASRYPWIDLTRVGIYGHSGGGNATASAMFHDPDFFQVGIAESGNQDNRIYEDDWGEKWQGLLVTNPDGTTNYDSQANQNFAKNLKGHLLLAHGTMDDNVPPANTLLVVDALIKANKDFDLILFPNAHHSYGEASQYMTRRRWDYFVRYLAGDTPPHEYRMKDYVQPTRGTLGPDEPADDYDLDFGRN